MISLVTPVYSLDDDMLQMARTAVQTARQYSDAELESIVVDDGSPVAFVSDQDIIVRLPVNSGYSVATNTGLRLATGDILICGNSDLVYTPGWLEALTKVFDSGYDIATLLTSDQSYETRDEIVHLNGPGGKFGSLFAMTRNVYETIGGFDERFRGYFSDTDFRRRALNAGFKAGKNWGHLVEHKARATYEALGIEETEFLEAQGVYKSIWGKVE